MGMSFLNNICCELEYRLKNTYDSWVNTGAYVGGVGLNPQRLKQCWDSSLFQVLEVAFNRKFTVLGVVETMLCDRKPQNSTRLYCVTS